MCLDTHLSLHCSTNPWLSAHMLSWISEKYQSHILSISLSRSNWGYDQLSLFNPSLPVFHHLSSDKSRRLLVAGMMLSHRLLVAGMMLAPQSKCSVPGSLERMKLCLFASYTYKRKSIRVFRRPILVYLDVRGVEIPLLSTVSISNCRYQEAPGEVVWSGIFLHSYRGGLLKFFDIWWGR